MPNECPSADLLGRYAAGALAEVEASAVDTHIGYCTVCLDRLSHLDEPSDGVMAALRKLPAAPPDDSPALARAVAAVKSGGGLLPPPELALGTELNGYRVVEELGRGGMGRVYRAVHPRLDQEVALKVLRPGLDSAPVLARFEAERQALARMDHPHIARVFDGGATAEGQPFFAMELIRGVPITRYCDDHHLDVRRRLDLFMTVCQAVQHAHQKGIIHRDLKPSNVLVTEYDGRPVAKVIDFGLAKPIDRRSAGETEVGMLVGTPESMSPEQADLTSLDIDTRTDVYALGALLYELLTGDTPFERRRLRAAPVLEVLRIVREEEPAKPSARLTTSESLPDIAANRGVRSNTLVGLVRGDLDWVVMKSLEKDRSRRYGSAGALADDVARYCANEPVQAGPPSSAYRLRKFVQRNKAALAVASLVLAFLVVLGAGGGWMVRDREARSALLHQQVNQALDDAAAFYARDQVPEAAAAVKRADGFVAAGGKDETLRAQVRQWQADLILVGRIDAIRLARTAVKENEFDSSGADTGYRASFAEYGLDVETHDQFETAARIRSSRIKDRIVAGLDDWVTYTKTEAGLDRERLSAIAGLADGDPWRARLREAMWNADAGAIDKLSRDPDALSQPPATILLLATRLYKAGAEPRAVEVLRKAQIRHPDDFWINEYLALSLKNTELAQAIGFHRAALALRPSSPGVYLNLGSALRDFGKPAESEAMYRKALQLLPDYAMAHMNLSNLLRETGRLDEAEREGREAVRLDPGYAPAHHHFGLALYRQGRLLEAEAEFREGLRLQPSASGHGNLGIALYGQKRLAEAEAELRQGLEMNPDDPDDHNNLASILLDQNKVAEAEAEYREALRLRPNFVLPHLNIAKIRSRQNRLAEAEAEYREAIRINANHAEAHCNLGQLFVRQGRYDDAVPELRRGHELGSARQDWRYPSAQWLHTAERSAALVARLPAILAGADRPETADDWLQCAKIAQNPLRALNAGAVRLYIEAFTADPTIAANMTASHRYNAACSAALGGAGRGQDANTLSEPERANLRRQALEWLRADLTTHVSRLDQGKPADRTAVLNTLTQWQRDPDFAGVRTADALTKLLEDEREAWVKFWTDVEALVAKARAAK